MPQHQDHIRWYFIVNPVAAKQALGRNWPAIRSRLEQDGIHFEAVLTQYKGHAIQLARAAVENGHRHLVGVGGDGTNNEVINGILQQQLVDSREITYTLLPVGTGNDWIRTHGIPKKLDSWIEMLKTGHTTIQDVGRVMYHQDGQQYRRYFVNVAGLAYDAFVVRYAEHFQSRFYNRLIYLFLILSCLFKYRLLPARVSFDSKSVTDHFYTINAGICRYSGGGMQLVPHAVPDDGLLALTYAGPISKLGVILNTYRFYTGAIAGHPKIHTAQTRHITIEAAAQGAPTLLEVDGEFLGETPCEIDILPGALRVVVPMRTIPARE